MLVLSFYSALISMVLTVDRNMDWISTILEELGLFSMQPSLNNIDFSFRLIYLLKLERNS